MIGLTPFLGWRNTSSDGVRSRLLVLLCEGEKLVSVRKIVSQVGF